MLCLKYNVSIYRRGPWLLDSVYTQIFFLLDLPGKLLYFLFYGDTSGHTAHFCPMASNLAVTKCRCCLSKLKSHIRFGIGRMTLPGNVLFVHSFCFPKLFVYWFSLQFYTTNNNYTCSIWQLWAFFFPLVFHKGEKKHAVLGKEGKENEFHFTKKKNPPTSCNTFPLRASFLFLQLPSCLWYIRVH